MEERAVPSAMEIMTSLKLRVPFIHIKCELLWMECVGVGGRNETRVSIEGAVTKRQGPESAAEGNSNGGCDSDRGESVDVQNI